MAETVAFKYRAFISYSHADTAWAKWLHRGLEGFRIDKDLAGRETSTGTIPKSLRPIFRDRDDFTAGHKLADQTLAALDASHALIVICSPSSAKSAYVTEEISLFKSHHPERPVIPLIVGGKPDDPELECFPSSLKFKLDADGKITDERLELLAADAREDGDGKTLALAKVVAGLLGVSSDDIYRRAERERRRKGRVRNGIIAVLAFLAIAASGSAVYAWQQLKTNEAFLTATLKTATEIVDEAVAQAEKFGVPRRATLALLTKAEGLFDNMALLGRPTPELRYQKAWMLIEFARNYAILGDTAKRKARAEEAHRLMAGLADEMPDDPEKLRTLAAALAERGNVLVAQGDLAAALQFYKDSLTIVEHLAETDPGNAQWQSDLSVVYNKIGDVQVALGDLSAALKAYRDSLGISERLAEIDPGNADWQRDLSVSHVRVGDIHIAQGNLAAALASYQDSLGIAKRLAETDPGNAGWQRDLSIAYVRIGDAQVAQGDLAAALQSYEEGVAILKHLADKDPDNTQWQRYLSISYERVGDVLKAQGDLAAAVASYRDSLGIAKRLAEADPNNAGWQRDLSVAYEKVGDVLVAQGDLAAALKAYRDILGIRERLAETDPDNAEWQRDLALGHGRVALVLAQQGETARAMDKFQEGRRIIVRLKERSPDNAILSNNLAWFDAEIAKLEQAQAAEPGTDQPEQAAR